MTNIILKSYYFLTNCPLPSPIHSVERRLLLAHLHLSHIQNDSMTSTDGLETERTACSKERSKRTQPAYDLARASSFSKKDVLATYYAKAPGVPRAMSKTDLDYLHGA